MTTEGRERGWMGRGGGAKLPEYNMRSVSELVDENFLLSLWRTVLKALTFESSAPIWLVALGKIFEAIKKEVGLASFFTTSILQFT